MAYVPPIQVRYAGEPFRVLVICALLNRATGRTGRPAAEELFRRWPEPADLSRADRAELEAVLRPCGFQRRRADLLIRMAGEWLRSPPVDSVLHLPGCGAYAQEAWDIFVRGRSDVEPRDRALRAYVERNAGPCGSIPSRDGRSSHGR